LSEMPCSDDDDRFVFQLLSQWRHSFSLSGLSALRSLLYAIRYVRAGRKPGSVSSDSHRVNRGTMTIPLVPMLPSGSSDLPGNSGGPPSDVPLFGLAPGGVFLAPAVTGRTGELLPHRFTLTSADRPPGRFAFCGTFLPVARTGSYPAPCPAEPGLSSPLPGAEQRSFVLL